jgi:hypothetical protein
MGHTNIRLALESRYAAYAGRLIELHENIARIRREAEKLPELEATIPELESLVESASMLLKDADPEWTPEQTQPLKPWTHNLSVPFSSCGRRGMEVLRVADKPMTTREIALEVLRQSGNEEPDRKLLHRTKNAVEASLRKFKGRTVEASGKYPMQWRTIAKTNLQFDV